MLPERPYFCDHSDCDRYLKSPCNEERCKRHLIEDHVEMTEEFKRRNHKIKVVRNGRGRFLACKKG